MSRRKRYEEKKISKQRNDRGILFVNGHICRGGQSMKKVIILLLAVLLILGSGMCGDALGNAMAEGPEETVRLTYYKSVRIRTGDTLWDLAEQYAPDTDLTIAQYVEKLRQMNSLKDDTIHAGNYLTVMYQEVKKCSN